MGTLDEVIDVLQEIKEATETTSEDTGEIERHTSTIAARFGRQANLGNAKKAQSSQPAEGGGLKLPRAGGKGLGKLAKLAKGAGAAAAVVIGVIVAMQQLVKKIISWSKAILEGARSLKQFNAQIAVAFAEADVRTIERQVKSGQRVSPAIEALSDSFQDFLDALQPIKDDLTIIVSLVLVQALNVLAEIVKQLDELGVISLIAGKSLEQLKELNDRDKEELLPVQEFFNAVADGKYTEKRRWALNG